MVQTLEAIRGGGGSIKVGTTGTIGALMSRELESIKPVIRTPTSFTSLSPTESASVTAGASAQKTPKSRSPVTEATSSSSGVNHANREKIIRKNKHRNRKTQQMPMLDSDNISIDGTPMRKKPDKRQSFVVDVVDIKCGIPERAWASPITNRLKKLGFSKLSQSMI